MMHPQIEDEEIIERYVQNRLAAEERKAFEEHFFGCDDCFLKVQDTERFVAGVRDAARRGLLAEEVQRRTGGLGTSRWLVPALGASASAALALAVLNAWLYFVRMPGMRQQLTQSGVELRAQQQARAALEDQLASRIEAEANLPLVMLQATRDAQTSPNEVDLPPGAKHLVLWIEVPATKSERFHLQLYTADNRSIETLDNLERNSYGALAVSLPVEALQPGDYRITLTGQERTPASLVGEYRLKIRKP